jgi:methionyl-tRNA formyltransferase
MTTPLRIIFAGSGEFAIPSLKGILDCGHQLVQLFTQPDRPAGRGRKLTPMPVAAFARDRCAATQTANINLESLAPADVLVVIAFGQKIADHVVRHPRLGAINLHASQLPKYRGAAPINAAILGGESVTGNSVIRLAQRMDAGAILAQSSISIGELETAGELHDRLSIDGANLVLSVLQSLSDGNAREAEQDQSRASLAPKLSRASATIDFNRPADLIARQIRGLFPWPGCRVSLLEPTGRPVDRLTLVRARDAKSSLDDARPGVISATVQLVGAAEREAVEILEVQPEGRKSMPLHAYRNGHRWESGMRLESIL